MLENLEFNQVKKPEKKGEGIISRRSFLKSAALVGAGLLLGKTGLELKKNLDSFLDEENKKDRESKAPTLEQEEIEEENREVIGKSLREQLLSQNKITIDRTTKKAIYEDWFQKYSPGGKDYKGMIEGLQRMAPWLSEMKAQFRAIGLPEKYVYISIPESHFNINARSRKSAIGPFQFMESSARKCGLKVEGIVDERLDPVKSARACAYHLKEAYLRLNYDWKMALAAYNGSYANDYAKSRNVKERNYDDYLNWRQEMINRFISQPFFEHKIGEEESLEVIGRKYGLSVEEIRRFNEVKSRWLVAGKKLKLPPKPSVKLGQLQDSLENLNYPEKFEAVFDVIRKNKLDEGYEENYLRYDLVEVPKSKTSRFSATVEKGEGLFAAARKIQAQAKKTNPRSAFSISQIERLIQAQNKAVDPRRVQRGQKLSIELPLESCLSLFQISRLKNKTLEKIKIFNPAILSESVPLPEGLEIRIPKA